MRFKTLKEQVVDLYHSGRKRNGTRVRKYLSVSGIKTDDPGMNRIIYRIASLMKICLQLSARLWEGNGTRRIGF